MKPAFLLTLGLVAVCAAPAGAQQYVYPAKGQSQAKQQSDEAACSSWATGQSGFDPAHPPAPVQAAPAPVTGSGSRLRGAAVGGAIGAVAGGDAGDAALAGAVVGGVAQRRRNARAAQSATAQSAAVASDAYLRARSACLSGRGYTVK